MPGPKTSNDSRSETSLPDGLAGDVVVEGALIQVDGDQGLGPHTINPLLCATNSNIGTAERCYAIRALPGPPKKISAIGIYVGVSNGNIEVGVGRGPGGRGAPTEKVASSGVVACPAAGYQEVDLTEDVIFDPATDYFLIMADGTTATFLRAQNLGVDSAVGEGFMYLQAAANPIPDALDMDPCSRTHFFMIGV